MTSLYQLNSHEMLVMRSQHRLEVVFELVTIASEKYKAGMQIYIKAMELASDEGLNVNIGLAAVSDQVEQELAQVDLVLINHIKREISIISKDQNIPNGTRQKFVEFWSNYLEFKSYVDNPRGTFGTYQAKLIELSDNHNRLAGSLSLLLGLDVEE